jgi:hypothetical protein
VEFETCVLLGVVAKLSDQVTKLEHELGQLKKAHAAERVDLASPIGRYSPT